MVLSELPHRHHAYPSSLTLVLFGMICGPPLGVVTVHHPPILAEHDWQGVGLGTSPQDPLAHCFHTPMESFLLVQTRLTCWSQRPHLGTRA